MLRPLSEIFHTTIIDTVENIIRVRFLIRTLLDVRFQIRTSFYVRFQIETHFVNVRFERKNRIACVVDGHDCQKHCVEIVYLIRDGIHQMYNNKTLLFKL